MAVLRGELWSSSVVLLYRLGLVFLGVGLFLYSQKAQWSLAMSFVVMLVYAIVAVSFAKEIPSAPAQKTSL